MNPTLQENYPVVEQVSIHVLYSADDTVSAAFMAELQAHGLFLGVPFASKIDVASSAPTVATATAALETLRTQTTGGLNHTIWILTPPNVLEPIMTAATNLNMLNQYAWVLAESNLLAAIDPSASATVKAAADGMLGSRRAKGYVAQDRMFSAFPYTSLPGNSYNFSGFTQARYCSAYPYPDIYTQFSFDAIGVYVRSLASLLSVASEGKVHEIGSLLLQHLSEVSFVGSSGPLSFQTHGKTMHFDYIQARIIQLCKVCNPATSSDTVPHLITLVLLAYFIRLSQYWSTDSLLLNSLLGTALAPCEFCPTDEIRVRERFVPFSGCSFFECD